MKTSYNNPFSAHPISRNISSVLAYLVYGLFFLLFAGLPSVVSRELIQPTQTGKSFAFAYLLLGVMILLLLPRLFDKRPLSIKFTLIDVLLGLMLLHITVNRYLLQESWGFSLLYYELLGLGILYLLLRQMDKDIYPWLFVAVIISGIIQSVYGNLQLYGFYPSHHSGFKMTGSFFNPGPHAGFLSGVFPVAFGVYLFRRSIFEVPGLKFHGSGSKIYTSNKRETLYTKLKSLMKYLLLERLPLAGIFLILMVLPASQSRAAWLSAGLSGVYLLAKKYQWAGKIANVLNSFFRKITVIFLLIILSAAIAYGLYVFKPGSADGRLLIWKVTANMFMDSPWIGHGFDRFKAGYMNYQAAYFQNDSGKEGAVLADNVYYAFNEPLQFAAENGIVGLMISAALLLSVFATRNSGNKFLLNIVKASLMSIIVFSLFSYPSQILPIKLITVLLVASAATFQNSLAWSFQFTGRSGILLVRRLIIGTVLTGVFGAIPAILNLRQAYKDWATASDLYQMGPYDKSLELYEKASTKFAANGDFLMNYGKALSMAEEHEKAVETLGQAKDHLNTTIIETALGDSYKALKKYEAAEKAYYQAWYMAPGRFYTKYLLAILYDENNQPQKARNIALELMEKEVKVESMAIEEIKAEMKIIINKSSS